MIFSHGVWSVAKSRLEEYDEVTFFTGFLDSVLDPLASGDDTEVCPGTDFYLATGSSSVEGSTCPGVHYCPEGR